MADEHLVLDPADRSAECDTNTWWLGAADGDRESLSVSELVAAFERTAAVIRARVRELGFSGPVTFYVWHDAQAGQLRCSTGSVPADALPFLGAHLPSGDLESIIEEFLADGEPEPGPLRVWVSGVGTAERPAGEAQPGVRFDRSRG
ncbi:hypothetical protein [Streptomyces aquilus]|uniref:hypothetical protein n=1 Tax=Streptomyces aquilus TaxID=2548456 RepID=UPI00367A9C1A